MWTSRQASNKQYTHYTKHIGQMMNSFHWKLFLYILFFSVMKYYYFINICSSVERLQWLLLIEYTYSHFSHSEILNFISFSEFGNSKYISRRICNTNEWCLYLTSCNNNNILNNKWWFSIFDIWKCFFHHFFLILSVDCRHLILT